jgi:2,3-bisphosphoglycerate-dependent phosphoglycerate mutase
MTLLLRAQFNRAAVALLLALVVPASTALRVPRAQVGPRGGRWTTATTTTTQSRALITSRRTHHRHRHGGGVWMMAMARDSGTVAANAAAQGVTKQNSIIEDDGFSTRYGRKLGWFGRLQVAIRNFIKMIFGLYPKQAGTLILVRHGESSFNFNSTFTGWVDADLSDRGRREMEHAGRLLLERGYNIDVAYTSRLKRAIRSSWIMLRELNNIFRPVYKSYRLNERMYGALEGLSKPGLAREMGKDVVIKYRTSLTERPPPMTPDHPFYHGKEAKYADLDPSELPLTESLEDCMKRSLPLYETRIAPDLKKGYNVLVVAHGNSLRGIVKHIDQLSADQIQRVGIPNGIPLVYKFDQNLKPIRTKARENEDDFLSGEFLEKKGLLRSALAQEAELSQKIPGYDLFDGNITGLEKVLRYSPPLDPRLNSLFRLDKERLLLEYVEKKDAGTDSSAEEAAKTAGAAAAMRRRYALSGGLPQNNRKVGSTASAVAIKSTGTTALAASSGRPAPLLVIMRHGKTEHNKLGLFTGASGGSHSGLLCACLGPCQGHLTSPHLSSPLLILLLLLLLV